MSTRSARKAAPADKPEEAKRPTLAKLTDTVGEASELLLEREKEHAAATEALEDARSALELAQREFDEGVAALKASAPAGVGWNRTA